MKRREFLKLSLVSTGTIALIGHASYLYADNRIITGKVNALNKPLADVGVSDGFSIVKTNRRGEFKLDANPAAIHVFVITPSGYEFTHVKGIPLHYQNIASSSDYNFDLSPLKRNDDKHNFIIWADPQVKNESNVHELYSQSVVDVQQLARELGSDALLHGVCVGDLVFDQHQLFPAYNQALQKMDIPFFQALGNHDMDYTNLGDETSDKTFKNYYGPTYYSFNRGKAHYVVLDNVKYIGKGKKYEGYITEQQLNWLKEDLKHVEKNSLVIICLHIPVHNSVKNKNKLYALLEPYQNTHIMSGHTHYNRNVIKNGVFEHNHGTVCGGWWLGPVCGDGTPRGYGAYKVDGNKLTWYYRSAGLAKTEQLRVYVDELTNQKRILANVWNWDPAWKVEYWVDDAFGGSMEQQTGVDPFCIQQNKNDAGSSVRTSPLARSTDHLFIAHTAASVKKVKVIATDRFDNKFEKTWTL